MKQRISFPARCYLGWLRWLQRGVNFVQAAAAGFWLGVLRREDLDCVDAVYYERQAMYREGSYNRSGLSWWEREALEKYFQPEGRLLVTSAGGGREVLALRLMGYGADGFECNPPLVEYANQLLAEEGFAPSVRACERDRCPEAGGLYDGAIIGWGSFMLIPGQRRRVRLLRDVRAQVKTGAPVLVSFFAHPGEGSRLRFIQKLGNVFRRCLRRELLEVGDDLAPNYVHHCSRAEVDQALRDAGFEMACFDTKDYGHAVGLAVPQSEPRETNGNGKARQTQTGGGSVDSGCAGCAGLAASVPEVPHAHGGTGA